MIKANISIRELNPRCKNMSNMKSILTLSCLALLTACTTAQQKPVTTQIHAEHTLEQSTPKLITNEAPSIELSERLGHHQFDNLNIHKQIEMVDARAQQRYLSTVPRDQAYLVLDQIVFFDGNKGVTPLRDIALTISRGDSRLIYADDVALRHSGLTIPIRVTYSETQHLFLNGKDIGEIRPTTPKPTKDTPSNKLKEQLGEFYEAHIPTATDSYVGARIYF